MVGFNAADISASAKEQRSCQSLAIQIDIAPKKGNRAFLPNKRLDAPSKVT